MYAQFHDELSLTATEADGYSYDSDAEGLRGRRKRLEVLVPRWGIAAEGLSLYLIPMVRRYWKISVVEMGACAALELVGMPLKGRSPFSWQYRETGYENPSAEAR